VGLIEERWLSYRYTIDWDSLAQGGEGFVVKVDSDDNGIFERTITSDSELTGDEFIRWTAGLGYLGFINKVFELGLLKSFQSIAHCW